jgi:threonine dehydrogenase-like Zn-dependent dehydrogenase
VPIDAASSNESAVIAQPMATVLSALSTIPTVLGKTVVVLGQGPIGLLFDACLASAGASKIIGIDVREARVASSCEFGATDAFVTRETGGRDAIERVAQLTGGVLADLVVEAVGHEDQQLNLACALARNKGRVLYFGIPPDQHIGVALEPIVRKSLTIHTSVPEDLRPFVTIAQRAIKRGRIDTSKIITHRFPFTQVQQAFETYRDRVGLKVLLDF